MRLIFFLAPRFLSVNTLYTKSFQLMNGRVWLLNYVYIMSLLCHQHILIMIICSIYTLYLCSAEFALARFFCYTPRKIKKQWGNFLEHIYCNIESHTVRNLHMQLFGPPFNIVQGLKSTVLKKWSSIQFLIFFVVKCLDNMHFTVA